MLFSFLLRSFGEQTCDPFPHGRKGLVAVHWFRMDHIDFTVLFDTISFNSAWISCCTSSILWPLVRRLYLSFLSNIEFNPWMISCWWYFSMVPFQSSCSVLFSWERHGGSASLPCGEKKVRHRCEHLILFPSCGVPSFLLRHPFLLLKSGST